MFSRGQDAHPTSVITRVSRVEFCSNHVRGLKCPVVARACTPLPHFLCGILASRPSFSHCAPRKGRTSACSPTATPRGGTTEVTTEQGWLPRGNERDRGDFPEDETRPRGRRPGGNRQRWKPNVSTVLRGRHVSWKFTRFLAAVGRPGFCPFKGQKNKTHGPQVPGGQRPLTQPPQPRPRWVVAGGAVGQRRPSRCPDPEDGTGEAAALSRRAEPSGLAGGARGGGEQACPLLLPPPPDRSRS